jgi:hypothetical protein
MYTFLFISLIPIMALCGYVQTPHVYGASYSVAPLVIDKELEGRDIFTETITLTNTEDAPIRVYPTVNEVKTEEGGKVTRFLEPSMIADRSTAVTSWIEIGRGRIELGPKEKKEVTLTVRVHPQAPAGEYHAFIGFPQGGNRDEAERVVYTGSAPGSVLRIGIDQKQTEFLRLERFSVERFVKDSDEGEIIFTLKNPGDDSVVPEGEIIFYNSRGIEVAAAQINEDRRTIEGGTDETFTANVPDTLTLGKYKAYLRVEFGKDQKTSINDTAFFYVAPLRTLLIAFGGILLVTLLLTLYAFGRSRRVLYDDHVHDVGLYMRSTRSEPKDHDIDLTAKKE